MDRLFEQSGFWQALQSQFSLPSVEGVASTGQAAVAIRPIDPGDGFLLQEMHRRLSPDSIYYRYLHAYTPKLADMEAIAHLEGDKGAAFVATAGRRREEIVGVAYYVVDPGNTTAAEPAILVEDAYQKQGVGRLLFERLARHADASGIASFEAIIEPDNDKMMRLLRRSGCPTAYRLAYGAREVSISVGQCPWSGQAIQ